MWGLLGKQWMQRYRFTRLQQHELFFSIFSSFNMKAGFLPAFLELSTVGLIAQSPLPLLLLIKHTAESIQF